MLGGQPINLIVNGSFENVTGLATDPFGFVGIRSIPGWTTADPNARIEVYNVNPEASQPASDGRNALDLEGSPGNIRIGQNIQNLVAGESYQLNFDVTDSESLTAVDGPNENVVDVFFGGQLIATIDPSNVGESEFETISLTLVAGSGNGSDRLEFQGRGPEDNIGVGLDNVQLFALTPAGEMAAAQGVPNGDDVIDGGEGADQIFGNGGNDTITGGEGNDTIFGDFGSGASGAGDLNQIMNGSFEDVSGLTSTFYGFVGTGSIPGWTTSDPNDEIDIHNDGRDGQVATDGANWLDLEASPGNIRIGQDVQGLVAGEGYELTFDVSDGGSLPFDGPDENLLNVYWGGQLVATIDPSNVNKSNFETITLNLVAGAGNGSDRLEFEGTGREDNLGVAVDNVSLSLVPTTDAGIAAALEGRGAGDDLIDGGTGDDAIVAGGGNDTITGGAGADQMQGGSGDDVFVVSSATDGAGDVIIGGNGPEDATDNDILDLTGAGPVTISLSDDATDEGASTGTVTFSNGAVLNFSQIETIITDPIDLAPVAGDDVASVDEDGVVTIDVLANDSDPDGDALTITRAVVPPEQGTVEIVGDQLVFTPAENFNGEATISYTVADPAGNTDGASVTVTVAPVNDAPDAVNDTATTDEEVQITIDVLANDSDVDGDALTITAASVPTAQGTVEIVGNQLVFTPAEDFFGPATISYAITDGNGGTDVAEVTVDVRNVNDAPVATNDIATTDEDVAVVVDLLGNDSDVDGDPLRIGTVSVDPAQGTVVDNGDGTVTFTPAPNFNGPATITYTVVDDAGGADTGTATVNVSSVIDPPNAVNDTATTDEDTPVTIDVLANDTDPDNQALTITAATVPAAQGTVEVVGNQLVFTPAENFNGEATITYSIVDTDGATDTATVAVTVTPVNDAPVALDDIATTDEDVAVVVDLLGNDSDVDGDPLRIGTVSVDPAQGSVVDNGDGTVTFTPAPDFNGPATITYTVVDDAGGEDSGTATVNVGAVNDAPIAENDTATTDEDTPVTIDVLANDSDPDSDPLTIIAASVPAAQGDVDVVGNQLVFTPAENFTGTATISYTVSDGNGLTDTATVAVEVGGVNDAPDAVNDTAETPFETPVTIDVLANDSDPENDPLTVTLTSVSPTQGTVAIVGNQLVFTPADGFSGPATISYTLSDGSLIDTAEVIVTVGADPFPSDGVVDGEETAEDMGLGYDDSNAPNDGGGDQITDGADVIDGNGGDDTINAAGGDDTVDGGTGDDVIAGGLGDDVIAGGEGADTLEGEEGADTIIGGAGDDVIEGGDGDDITYGDDAQGFGTLSVPDQIADQDGAGGDDLFIGGLGADQSWGEGGNDTLAVGSAANGAGDIFVAGNGPDDTTDNDVLDLRGAGPVVIDASPDATDDGAQSGTVTFADGSVLTFFQVETILTDPDGVVDGEETGEEMLPGYDDSNAPTDGGGDVIGAGDDVIDGNGGDDTIDAGLGNDTVDGGTGDDVIGGGEGDDLLAGGLGDDEIEGGEGADDILGGDGADTLVGGAGVDTLDGGDGDDLIAVGGADQATGGDGDDVFVLDQTDPAPDVDVTLDGGSDGTEGNGAGPENGDAGDILDLSDQPGDLTVVLGPNPESGTVDGLDADDTPDVTFDEIEKLLTGTGNDTIDGGDATTPIDVDTGAGDDDVTGGAGDDTIAAGPGDDRVDAGAGDDDDTGGAGDDVIDGGAGDDVLDGGDDDDSLSGGDGADSLIGDDGSDTLAGGEGPDTLEGGTGDDDLLAGAGDLADGGAGDDEFRIDPTLSGTDPITIIGGETDEEAVIDPTNNPLGRIGDTLDLSGLDVVSVTFDPTDPSFDPVTGVGESGTVVFNNAAGEPVTINFSEIENVIFDPLPDGVVDGEETSEEMGLGYDDSNDPTDGGGDQITNGDDVIDGNGGNDTINAGDGNDTVDGGIGNDVVNGAEGDDVVDGGAGDDLVTGGAGNDTVLGGDGDDELRGNEGNDLVDGGEGNDSMGGAEGDDTLLGGTGTDTLSGGSGDDVLDGGADDDTLNGDSGDDSITDLEGNNLIDAGTLGLPDRGFPIVGNADTDPTDDRDTVTTGAGNDTISTGDDADVIDAGDGNNVIDAGFDDDLITSGSGDDSIISGEGSDTIEAGAGNDTIFGGVGPTVGDLVNLIDDNVVPLRDDPILDNGDDLIDAGDGDDLVFGEDDNDTILGGAGNDTLDGGIDDDVIEGGAGDDLVIGGQGADSLSGGLGNDTFTIGDFTDPIYGDTYKEGLGDTIFGGEDPDGNDVDVLDLSAAGPLRIDYDATDPTFDPTSGVGESGTVTFFTDATQTTVAGTLSFAEIENVIPCFTPGTLIATPRGEVPVDSLREGDRVITRDNGIQEIRWVGNRTLSRDELALNPSLKPILIKAGSLGQGLPERDMVVSPQHRLLIAGDRTQLYFDESEVLVAAKHLVNNGAIQTLETLRTTYIHFMFDRHEVVLSDGAWTESFQPGDQTLGAMGQAARDEIVALFPELATAEGVADYAAARRALKAHEAKLLQL